MNNASGNNGDGSTHHPYMVALVAILLPGYGQVLNRQPARGLRFAFFTLLLGWITFQLTTQEHSLLGRYAGGLFIYSLSVLDAYKWARVRRAEFHFRHSSEVIPSSLPK
ncbi:MAG: hypothetical protein ACR2KU_04300 [Gammaproteobacteria bacterium]